MTVCLPRTFTVASSWPSPCSAVVQPFAAAPTMMACLTWPAVTGLPGGAGLAAAGGRGDVGMIDDGHGPARAGRAGDKYQGKKQNGEKFGFHGLNALGLTT